MRHPMSCSGFLLLPLLWAGLSCSPDGFGGLLGDFVTIEIENATSFTAIPDLRTGDSRNFAEDIFDAGRPVTNFGSNGTIAANQTVTIRLPCDGDLEMIAFGGSDFRDANNFPLGDVSGEELFRRDVEFDCGDVIRIRLSGGFLNFDATFLVQRSEPDGSSGSDDTEGDEIADFLDDLFGS